MKISELFTANVSTGKTTYLFFAFVLYYSNWFFSTIYSINLQKNETAKMQ